LLKSSVQATLEKTNCPADSDCSVGVTDLKCANAQRAFRGLTTSSLTADFDVILTVYCQTSDCSDAEEIAQGVFKTVQETFQAAIADNSFIEALQSEALYSSAASAVFASSAIAANAFTLDRVITLLDGLTEWYPTWHNADNTCSNDGNAPAYMTFTGNFIHGTLESCCNAYYSWKFTECMLLGGATSATYANNEFYVDYISMSCKQSCEVGTAGLNCAGIALRWMTVFVTAKSCCEGKLWWLGTSACVADSTLTSATATAGSGEWYRKEEKCVKDCDDGSDIQCGGMAKRWEETFSSLSACCATKLWWVETSKCT